MWNALSPAIPFNASEFLHLTGVMLLSPGEMYTAGTEPSVK